jgi:hypothetical protein
MSSVSIWFRYIALLAPIGWGLLSYLVFSVLKPRLPISHIATVPLWVWLWIFQMILVIPFWVGMSRHGFNREQRQSIGIFRLKLPLGRPFHYLVLAYLTAVSAIPFHDRWSRPSKSAFYDFDGGAILVRSTLAAVVIENRFRVNLKS